MERLHVLPPQGHAADAPRPRALRPPDPARDRQRARGL